ncbi:TrmB family transcriptional regulator [Clostridium sp. C8-1-8]|uniref:TrmB family transcriptional regulator n=1 Tax=Clostridium sp. C8-1-8 TaxID=2698831 RepID=UPI00136EBD96|nr:TrmB family transcriptional regulator [Clostridium sp. C8-1-8]
MNDIINKLQDFNFTKTEAEVYLCLLKNGQLNGSQISKLLNISRSSVYSCLESLYKRGNVLMLSGEPTIYKAQSPDTLINNIKANYQNSIEILEESLSNMERSELDDQYWNMKGYSNFIETTKKLLVEAESEVYISTTFELKLFEEELKKLIERNIRIIVFSFESLDVEGLDLEYYHHESKSIFYDGRRWMMIVDNKKALIANETNDEDILGTVTENSLMVSIISEHIHHDIYLLKLKDKYNKNLVTSDILINSGFEMGSSVCKSKKDR